MENPFFVIDNRLNKFETLLSQIVEKLELNNKKEEEEKLLSPAQTCNLFHPQISKNTLKRWTDNGKLKDYRIGGRVYYKQSEVIEAATHLQRYKK